MKTNPNSNLIRSFALGLGAFVWLVPTLEAAPFIYNSDELILAFRQVGNASDLVVNIGRAATLANLPAGTSVPITNLSVAQLTASFASIDDLFWSVSGSDRLGINYPAQTLWASSPRTDNNVPASPWLRQSVFAQGSAASIIDAVGGNAAAYSSGHAAGANNTVTGVVIPATDPNAYTPHVSGAFFGNFDGTFQGNVENTTASDFDSAPDNVSRSDLYELRPGSGPTRDTPGKLLGSFDLKSDGTLTFTAAVALPKPAITSIQRNGSVTTVSFTTANTGTYRLRFTGAAGLASAVSTWSTNGVTLAGTGAVSSLQATNAADIGFYSVEALP